MTRTWLVILLMLVLGESAFSQGFKMHYSSSFADCFGAVEVYDYTVESQIQFPGNFGQRDDFMNMYPDFHEVNSVWLRLEPNVEGTLEFEIFTENNVDFSYFLFRAADNTFCEKLESDKVTPVLYDMSMYYEKGIEENPRGENFKPSVACQMGDVFYLLIHTNSTYTGKVRVRYNRIGTVGVTRSKVQDFRKNKDDHFVRLKIRDKETGEPVEANLIISGVNQDNALFMGTDFIFSSTSAKTLHVESNTQGYFIYVRDITMEKDPDTDTEIVIELEKLAPGKKLLLEDIKFSQDEAVFLPISMPALKRLLDFLALNETVRIEIQGHVNDPGNKNPKHSMSLSEERAKAVKKWLKDNGIDDSRLVAVGYGATQMLYEKPKNSEEEEANRRVTIMIIE
ncbi:MAG: OmpA family protein [Crocinitomicaceae bacterium]|nr:OmpA family protein [Crocinitomicaceae bacterium]